MSQNLEVGVKITADGKGLVGEARAAKNELSQLGETAKRANTEAAAAAERFTANLKRQADTLGMTSAQVRAYDAAQMDLTQAQRASVEASNRAITSYENQQVALDDLRTRAAAAGVAVGAALVAGLKSSITAAGQAEQSHLRLAAVLNATGYAAGLTKTELDNMAGGMKERLGISDGTLRESMAVLLTFKNVSRDSFAEALEVSADLAAVMQTDLKSAVLQLGKALESPDEGLAALRRSGVSFTETQKDMIKELVETGKQAEAITLILQSMKEKGLDNVSESMNQGITKATRDASTAWGDLLETIGGTDTVKSSVETVFGSFTGYLKDMRQVIGSGDWLDRLAFFTIGLKTPSMIAKSNASAAAVDPVQQALADEGLARQKAAQQAEIAAIAKKKADEDAAKAAEEASRRAIAAAKAREEAEKRAYERAVEGSIRVIAALKLETEQIGLNAIQKKMLVAATEAAKAPTEELAQEIMASAQAWALATQQQEELVAAEKERMEAIKAIEKAEQDAAKAAEDSARATAQYWSGIWGNMESTGRNAFIQLAARGKSAAQSIGDAIKYSVIDLIYQITARPIIVRVGAEIGSILGFGGGVANAASSAGGIGNLLSMGSNALSIDNLVSKSASALGFSSFSAGASGAASAGVFGPGGLSYLGGAGTAIGGNAAGATGLAAASASEFGAAATLGSSFASGLAAAAGPLAIAFAATQGLKMLAGDKRLGGGFGNVMNKIGDIPILGDMMPIIPLINALFGRGPLKQKETQLTGEVGAGGLLDGYLTANFKAKGGLLVGSKRDFAGVNLMTGAAETDNSKALSSIADGMVKYAMQLAQQINQSVGVVNTSLRDLSGTLGLSTKPLDDFRHQINLVSESGKALTDEQIAQEIANISDEMVKSLLPTVDQFAKSGESSIQTITRLGAEFNALVSGAQLLLGKSATDAKTLVSGSTYEGRTAFVDAAGGLEAFNQQVTFFADNFLTDAQRLAPVQEQLNAGLKNLGLSTDLTRDQFRDLVQSFGQVNGISGETLQSLLNLQGVFITVRDAQDQLVAKEQEKANQIKNERLGLEAQLLQLQGNTAELRKLELAQLDPTNRILKEWVYWLQDAKDAAQKQVQVEQEKSGLETKLLQLQGNTAELRKLELAQLDPANRALQERIWLIENERAAAAKNTQTLKNNLSTAFGALQKSVDAERKSVETHIDNIGKSLDKLKSLSGALQNTLGRMQSAGDAGEQRAAAQAQIAAALAIARAGGALPDAESLQRSLDIVAQPSEDLYGSFVDYMRDFARTAADIISLDGLAQDQISAQESAIEIEKSQLEYLDGILKTAQDQVDALNGIDNSVLSLAQALQGLNAAVGAVKNNNIAIAAAESKTASAASPAASAVAAPAAPAPAPLSASTSAGAYSAQEIPPQGINPGPVLAHPVTADGPSQITDAQIRDYVNTPGRTEIEIYNAARDNGISFARYAAVTGADINNLYSWADAHGLPRFASGGFHTGGLRIVGERGPEIEYTGPSRIFSNTESRQLLDLSEVVAELKQLRNEIVEVRKSTRQTADLLDDVSAGGGAFLVETA